MISIFSQKKAMPLYSSEKHHCRLDIITNSPLSLLLTSALWSVCWPLYIKGVSHWWLKTLFPFGICILKILPSLFIHLCWENAISRTICWQVVGQIFDWCLIWNGSINYWQTNPFVRLCGYMWQAGLVCALCFSPYLQILCYLNPCLIQLPSTMDYITVCNSNKYLPS